jgi:putative flippase GtrA
MLHRLHILSKKLPAETWPFARFCAIGLLNATIHFSMLNAIVFALSLKEGRPTSAANAAAFLIANLFSYQANSRWNFKVETSFKRYTGFLVTSLAGACFSYLMMQIGQNLVARFDDIVRDWVLASGISFRMSAAAWHRSAAFMVQLPFMALMNFSLLRLLVFPREKKAEQE